MITYYRQILQLLYKLLIILFLFTLSRVFFFAINFETFNDNSVVELCKNFFFGVRFDYSAIIQFNLLFIVLYLLPFNFVKHKNYQRTLNAFFFAFNFLMLLTNFVDCEYFKFTGKRSTADLFGYIFLSSDVAKLMPQFLADFWYIAIAWLLCIFLGLYLNKKNPWRKNEMVTLNIKSRALVTLLFILVPGILFIGARGVGLKPIRIISAARYTSSHNIPLLMNTPFCILHTINNESVKPISYFDNSQLEKIYTPEHQPKPNTAKRTDNVVIIILESFSKEFVGSLTGEKTYTPNLDSIIRHGLVFENTFANGKRSIEAVPAILAGLPALTDDSYISSRFSGNQIIALPSLLSSKGYQTSFFHGGRNGTMGFDEFSRIAGIKEYYGYNEYNGPSAFDGNWGIYDEEYLQYYANKLSTFKQPFFSCIFTLSSHHPYRLPEKYKNSFNDAPDEQTRSICYADYALGKFFKTISQLPWYKHTLFILVADHTAKPESKLYGTKAGMYRIPLVFFHPGDSTIKGRSSRVSQQADIMPSVLDYLGINKPFLTFGNSVFDNSSKGFSVDFLGGIYQLFQGNEVLSFDGDKAISLYNFSSDKMLMHNQLSDSTALSKDMTIKLQAIIQQFNSRLLGNKLFNIHFKEEVD